MSPQMFVSEASPGIVEQEFLEAVSAKDLETGQAYLATAGRGSPGTAGSRDLATVWTKVLEIVVKAFLAIVEKVDPVIAWPRHLAVAWPSTLLTVERGYPAAYTAYRSPSTSTNRQHLQPDYQLSLG